jgi:GNAT superfamily N-acetyltransferase
MTRAGNQHYRIRIATAADAAVIAHHRAAMFRDMGVLPEADVAALSAATRAHLATVLPSGVYRGWLAERDGEVVAGGGLLVQPTWPRPEALEGGAEAYLLNVYTEPAHRRRGVARALMDAMLAWCRARGITRFALHASDEGRPLYESLGFIATNEMRRMDGGPAAPSS